MDLADRLHCPRCKGRLSAVVASSSADVATTVGENALHCPNCGYVVPVRDGIADFVGDRLVSDSDPYAYSGDPFAGDASSTALMDQIQAAAGDRWPVNLGDMVELGCGGGQLTRMLASSAEVRGLLVTDTSSDMVQSCRARLTGNTPANPQHAIPQAVLYARLSGQEDAIRDAVADTVVGSAVLHRFGDVRAFLATVHRVLKPGGRAFFVVPNRRYHQAFCHAMATALVRQYARTKVWTEPARAAMRMLAESRQQLVHQGDQGFLSSLREKHLFDSDGLEDMAREVGFATADAIPLHPDPLASETAARLCRDASIHDEFAAELAPLVASAGAPFFSLLSRQDASASMLLWLTKGVGPRLRIFSGRPKPPAVHLAEPDSALGGAPPRWSVELSAHDTTDGVVVSVGGWCLVNTDVVWVRLRLDGVTGDAPVWRSRPDVHEVLNTQGLYHPLNALCCGMDVELLFDGVHPQDNRCALRVEVVLANGLVVQGPAPHTLVMEEPLIIAQ